MDKTSDQVLGDVLSFGVTVGLTSLVLGAILSRFKRGRPELALGLPLAVAFSVRVSAAIGASLTGIGESLRGPDEAGFVQESRAIAEGAEGAISWGEALVTKLYEFVFAAQISVFDSPEMALRAGQAGIAVLGLLLLAVAVYELAGPRAAVIALWVLALEPTSIFFSTLLHKEANMILAGGLVAFGGSMLWKYGSAKSLLPMVLGCLIAVATRPYAGWFLIAASAAITLHAGLRVGTRGSLRGVTLIAAVLLLAAVAAPTVFEASTEESLEQNLQGSQDANASNEEANLTLEQVDFSSRSAILVDLPVRIRDVVFRPYPWQIDNTSQQLGLIGTLIVLTLLILLVREIAGNWGQFMARAGPLVYTAAFLLVAYSLSAGNAGTAFRYRMHVVAIALCIFVVLLSLRRQERSPESPALGRDSRQLASITRGEPVPRDAPGADSLA